MPITSLKMDKKKRRKVYFREALIFSVILTTFDFIAFYKLSIFDMLNIFDVSLWNILITVILTFLIILLGSYLLDYIITEIIIKINRNKRKKNR